MGIRGELGSILFGYENWHQILESQDYFSRITATSPFTHKWSLAVELQYYLVWPLLLGLYRSEQGDDDKWGTIGILIALAVASAGAMAYLYYATGDPSRSYYGTDTRVHALLLGGAIGMIPPERLRCSKGLGGTLFALGAAGYLALEGVAVERDAESGALTATWQGGQDYAVWYADGETLALWRDTLRAMGYSHFDLFRLGGNSSDSLAAFLGAR